MGLGSRLELELRLVLGLGLGLRLELELTLESGLKLGLQKKLKLQVKRSAGKISQVRGKERVGRDYFMQRRKTRQRGDAAGWQGDVTSFLKSSSAGGERLIAVKSESNRGIEYAQKPARTSAHI